MPVIFLHGGKSMKKSIEIVIKFCLLISGLFFISCSNTYDDLLNDFNDKYFSKEPTPVKEKKITDDDFAAEKMLENRYAFVKGYETSLSAPLDCTSYKWEVQKGEQTEKSDETEQKELTTVCTKRVYNFMPGVDFKLDEEATLVLTVTDAKGTEYIDTALIIVISRK